MYKTGLPYHNHGKTWIAVVHGAKKWFLYPPGYDVPPEVDSYHNPLLPMSNWINDVYPKLFSYPKPPLVTYDDVMEIIITEYDHKIITTSNLDDISTRRGYRPLECAQQSGDILFVPQRWTHMTFNYGDTIAIGGQETLYDEDR